MDTDFNFIKFINTKGFKMTKPNKFIFEYSDEYTIVLEIENDEYKIPIGFTERFISNIPKNIQQAEENFNTIANILNINFK